MRTAYCVLAAVAAICMTGCSFARQASDLAYTASGQQQRDISSIRKLRFMAGSWHCVVHGGPANGYATTLSYSFSPDGQWVIEQERGPKSNAEAWSLQMWGYDFRQHSLVAYQFTPAGLFTKTIRGWKNGEFVSTRDDNSAVVSLRQRSRHAVDWVIQPADKSAAVIEACTK
jgi:hypothetical protein